MAKKTGNKKKSAAKKVSRKPAKKKIASKVKKPKAQQKPPADSDEETESPGWDAIDAALLAIYGTKKPEHYGTLIPYGLGGPDPLTGISAYYRDQPTPHFHYVTYGFSDLYGEGEPGAEESNYGFELTFRLATRKKSGAPKWPLNFLNNIARYVFQTGNTFDAGHHIDLNGPIALDEKTDIGYIGFALDPELGECDTPVGHLKFLQIVGLIQDEFELAKRWSTEKVLGHVGDKYPLLVTDLQRQSILNDSKLGDKMRAQAEVEGSRMSQLFVSVAEFEKRGSKVQVTLGAHGIPDLRAMLKGQVAGGGACALIGKEQVIAFETSKKDGWSAKKNVLTVTVSPKLLQQLLESLKPQRGEYTWPTLSNLVINVVPSEITNRDGKVIKTIG